MENIFLKKKDLINEIIYNGPKSQTNSLLLVLLGCIGLFFTTFLKSQTPYKGTARKIPGAIHAEDYDLGGQNVAYFDITSGNNGNYYRFDDVDISYCVEGGYKIRDWQAGEWMIYTVNITKGVYNMYLRIGTSESGKHVRIYLDGSVLAEVELPFTGGVNNFQTIVIPNISFTGGENQKLKIESVDGGAYFNWIDIYDPASPAYDGIPHNIPGVIEAEEYDLGGSGVAYWDQTPGNNQEEFRGDDVDISVCNEGGFKVRNWEAGEWMVYSVNAVTSNYDLNLRVGTKYSGLRIKIYMDNELIATTTLPNTGDNNNFQTVTIPNVYIQGGNNKKLKIENIDGEVYLNWIQFVYLGERALPPGNLKVDATSDTTAKLTWEDNSSNESGFIIERKMGAGTWIKIITEDANVVSFTDKALQPATSYSYRIAAFNENDTSDYSYEVTVTTPSRPNAPGNLTEGLEEYYTMDEVAGQAVDSKSLVNSVSVTATRGVTGKLGNCYQFDGATDIVTFGDHAHWTLKTTDNFSISAWIQFTGNTVGAWGTIIGTSSKWSFGIKKESSGVYSLAWIAGMNIYLSSTFNPALGNWYHIAMIKEGNSLVKFYLNNILVGTAVPNDLDLDPTYNYIGNDGASNGFKGYIDEIGVWRRTLSADEINLLYNSGNGLGYPFPSNNNNSVASPANLNATATSDTTVNLTWDDNSSNETGFIIERRMGAGPWNKIITGDANVVSFIDKALQPATNYSYRIAAFNENDTSDYSNEVTVTTPSRPIAPGNLVATALSGNIIKLNWTDNATNELGFKLERRTGTGPFAQIAVLNADSTLYINNGLSTGTGYTYRVYAYNALGNSLFSNEVNITTPSIPAAPAGLSATATSTQVNLTWNDVTNEDGYKIERKNGSSGTWEQIAGLTANSLTFSNLGVVPGTTYYYRILAYSLAGNSSYSLEVNITVPFPPTAPSNLISTYISGTTVDLSWADNSTNESGFKIERRVEGGDFTEVGSVGANVKAFYSPGLVRGTNYTYRIRAYNANGYSDYSNILAFKTPSIPAAPTDLTVTVISETQMSLSWTNNAPDAYEFLIFRKVNGNWVSVDYTSTTSYKYNGVPGNMETFTVQAVNKAGNSPYAVEVSKLFISRPAVPNLERNSFSRIQGSFFISLYWSCLSDYKVDGFKIERKEENASFVEIQDVSTVELYPNFTDFNVELGKNYTYRIRAYNSTGYSGYSNEMAINTKTPTAPYLNVYTSGRTQNTLSWVDYSNDEDGFGVYRKEGTEAWKSLASYIEPNVTTFTDKNAVEGAIYTYKVFALKSGISSTSNEVTITTSWPIQEANAPTNFRLKDVIDTRALLAWKVDLTGEPVEELIIEKRSSTGAFAYLASVSKYDTTYIVKDLIPGNTYYFRMMAMGESPDPSNSQYTDELKVVTKTPIPAPPSDLIARYISPTKVKVIWKDNSNDEANFVVYENGSTYWMKSNQNYFYRDFPSGSLTYKVVGVNNKGEQSVSSNTFTLTGPPSSIPAAPSSLSYTLLSPTSVKLTWVSNSNNESGFYIYSWGGPERFSINVPFGTNECIINNLALGNQYAFNVSAYNHLGKSTYPSNQVSFGTPSLPAAPSNLSTTGQCSGIDLTWTDNSNNEDGFKIERNSGSGFTEIATVSSNVTSYSNSGLTPGSTYTYRVRAYNVVGNTTYSNEKTGTVVFVSAPSALSGIPVSATQINLSWVDNSSNESGFNIERKAGNGNFSVITNVSPNITTYSNAGLTSGQVYTYRIVATNGSCISNYSNELTITPILPPTTLTSQTISASQINLTWADKSTNEDGFKIERKTGTDAFAEFATVGANITSYNNTGLIPGITYTYRVSAYNAGGKSAYSNETASQTLLSTPTNLLATVISDKQINISWTDNASNETGYKVEQRTGSGTFTEIATLGPNVNSYSSANLSPQTIYSFRVKAVSATVSSDYSNEASGKTFYLPAVPINISASPQSPTEVFINWTDQADNEIGFKLECKTGAGTFVEIADLSPNVKEYTHKGLTTLTNYVYRVKAYNAIGSSAYSAEVTTSIPLPPVPPSNLKAKVVSGNDIELTWTDNSSDEVFFLIYINGSMDYYTSKNVTTYIIKDLPDGIYKINVDAFTQVYKFSGGSSPTITVNLNPTPAAPTQLNGSAAGNTVSLSWTDNSSDESGFSVERSANNGSFAQVATVAPGVTSYTSLPLSFGKLYKFRVRAFGVGTSSDPTTEYSLNLTNSSQVMAVSDNYNFVQTITYNENGEADGQSIAYSDDLGRPLQSLSQVSSSRLVVGAQSVYDSQNRPALGLLPVPFSGSDLKLVSDLATGPDGKPYDYTHLEKTAGPDALSGKIATYYGTSNSLETNVPVTTYPYTRTDYSKITGAARKTALAGEAHRLGSGHETQAYTMPAPEGELMDFATSTTTGFGSLRNLGSATDTDVKLEYKGLIKSITIDADGKTSIAYSSEGKLVASCMVDETSTARNVSAPVSADFNYYDIHISSSNSQVTVNNAVSFLVYDLGTDLQVGTSYTGSVNLGKGVYRIVCTGAIPAGTTITYPISYTDYSFSMYDETGRPVYTVSPKSYQEWVAETSKTIANFKATYASWNKYNSLGQLLQSSSPDEGTSTFVYRKDGKIRFSQNAQQANDKKFSYTNYDYMGRACESGEYVMTQDSPGFYTDQFDAASANNVVEEVFIFGDTNADGLDDANCQAQTWSYYDIPEENVLPGYSQHYTYGAVTKNVKETSTTWYSYTYDGKTEWVIQQLPDVNKKSIDYAYNFDGQTETVTVQKGKKDEFTHRYEYDADGRLEYVYTRGNTDLAEKLQAHYLYYAHGPLKRTEYGGNLQGIDYIYTINGWLKSMNDPNVGAVDGSQKPYDPGTDGFSGANSGFGKDVFGMTLDYFTNDYTSNGSRITSIPGTACYNGNIAASRWGTFKDNAMVQSGAYQYAYDRKNWMTDAIFGSIQTGQFVAAPNSNYRETVNGYDLNGNIQGITRNASVLLDKLNYSYTSGTNKLLSTIETNSSSQLDQHYTYNAIGQLTDITYTDRSLPAPNNTGIKKFTYDVYGHVTKMENGEGKPMAIYTYDALGFRTKKEDFKYSGTEVTITKTWYLRDATGNILATYDKDPSFDQYKVTEQFIYGTSRIGVAQADGYGDIKNYAYEITDHLGNVRATVTTDGSDANTQPDVLTYADYYPFGLEMPGRSYINSSAYRFGYQGQYAEKDPETGYNHFEARDYDPRIGRWLIPDPAGQFWSPYLGMGNNPLIIIDKDGELAWFVPGVIGFCVGAVSSTIGIVSSEGWSGLTKGKNWARIGVSSVAGFGMAYIPSSWGGYGLMASSSALLNTTDQLIRNGGSKGFSWSEVGYNTIGGIGGSYLGNIFTKYARPGTMLGSLMINNDPFWRSSNSLFRREFMKGFMNGGNQVIGAFTGMYITNSLSKLSSQLTKISLPITPKESHLNMDALPKPKFLDYYYYEIKIKTVRNLTPDSKITIEKIIYD